MIHATLKTKKAQRMEEGALHKWLASKGFDLTKSITRIDHRPGLKSIPPGHTLFWQPSPPGPSFKIRPNLSEFVDVKAEDRNKRRWEKEGAI